MAKEKKQNKLVLKRHQFIYAILRPLCKFAMWVYYGYKSKTKYKLKKDEQVIILSNHQTNLDFLAVFAAFNKPIYTIGSENLFAGNFGKFLTKDLGFIPKKKGASDIRTAISMLKIIKEGGSLLFYPEGNRTYAEFQFKIDVETIKVLKKLNVPIVIFNMQGGTGASPRFKHKNRRGSFTGIIRDILKPEDYQKMTNDELQQLITYELRVYDSESGNLYKSNRRAEYLEREFFLCPKCNHTSTLVSKKNIIKCTNCGIEIEYTEDMKFKSEDPDFKFQKHLDWWNYQKQYIRNLNINNDDIIFADNDVKLFKSMPYQKKVLISKGKMYITRDKFVVGEKEFLLKDIVIASVLAGNKLLFTTTDDISYIVRDNVRLNPLKYVFLFNKLDTKMKLDNRDIYFRLEDD